MGRTPKTPPSAPPPPPPPFEGTVGPELLRFYVDEIAENEQFRLEQQDQQEELFGRAYRASLTLDHAVPNGNAEEHPLRELPLAAAVRYLEAALLELRHAARTQYLVLADLLRQLVENAPARQGERDSISD